MCQILFVGLRLQKNSGDLIKQRRRWHIGLFECMKRYKDIFLKPHYGKLGNIAYTYFLIYELLSPYIEVSGIAVTILLFVLGLVYLKYMVAFYIFYTLLGGLITVVTYSTTVYFDELRFSMKKNFKVVLLCLFEVGFLRLVLSFVRFVSLIGYRENKYRWDKIGRVKM